MSRPVTLFTGQWADLPLADLAAKTAEWGFDGLELACWGDHFDVAAGGRATPATPPGSASCSSSTGSACGRSATTSSGQCVADPIDVRHQGVLDAEVWGDGDPEGVRQRAAERMKDTARAAAQLGVEVVTGFTGSPGLAPPVLLPAERLERGRGRLCRSSPSAGGRSSTCSTRGREVRARGAPDRDRLRLRHDAQGARRDRQPRGLRDQLRPEPLRAPVPRLGRVHHRVRRPHLPRAHQGLGAPARRALARSSAGTSTSASPAAAGTSSRPGTATSTSSR